LTDEIDAMTIIEWLRRLNLVKYATQFKKKKIFWVTDLRWFEELGDEFEGIDPDDLRRMTEIRN